MATLSGVSHNPRAATFQKFESAVLIRVTCNIEYSTIPEIQSHINKTLNHQGCLSLAANAPYLRNP